MMLGHAALTAWSWKHTTRASQALIDAHSLPLAKLKVDGILLWSSAFSPDGQRVVTACSDGTARIWEASTGKQLIEMKVSTEDVPFANFRLMGGA